MDGGPAKEPHAETPRQWWRRPAGIPPHVDQTDEGFSLPPFWPKAHQAQGPDGRAVLVAVRANGVPSEPLFGGAVIAMLGLPIHLWAVTRGKGWRVDVDDPDLRKKSLRSWGKPRPWITTVAEFRTKSEAQSAADALIGKITRDGWLAT